MAKPVVESDLDLEYIGKNSARILAAADLDETISFKDVRELWDTIGDLIGEVERLLRSLNEDLTTS